MKRLINIALLLTLCCLPMAAQLNGTGFYRFRNADRTGDYISMANDKFNFTTCISTACGGLSQALSSAGQARAMECAGKYLETDIHMVQDADFVDVGSVVYAQKRNTNASNYEYNLIGQGTSLLTLTSGTYPGTVQLQFDNRYVKISRASGSGANTLYTASIELKSSTSVPFYGQPSLGTRYLIDNGGKLAMSTSSSSTNAKWYIEPITHFNVTPEVEYAGKHYTTLYVPFAYQLSGAVVAAYVVTAIDTDGTLTLETVALNGQTVPAGTPVLLECSSNVAADCQLIPLGAPLFTAPNVSTTSGAPASSTETNFTGTNLLKGNYYCNTDGAMTFTTSSGTSSFQANHYTARAAKLKVIGLTASGKLGMVTPPTTWTAMPANKAWIEYTGTAELVLPFATPSSKGDVDRDGDVDIDDVNAAIDIVLGRDIEAYNYDLEAADADDDNDRDIDDVNTIIDMVLGRLSN